MEWPLTPYVLLFDQWFLPVQNWIWKQQNTPKQFHLWLTPADPYMTFDQECIILWSGFLPNKMGSQRIFLYNFTTGWPQVTPAWHWPQHCITCLSGILPTKFGSHRAFLSNSTTDWSLSDPCMTFKYSNALHLVQGFSLRNLVAIKHC